MSRLTPWGESSRVISHREQVDIVHWADSSEEDVEGKDTLISIAAHFLPNRVASFHAPPLHEQGWPQGPRGEQQDDDTTRKNPVAALGRQLPDRARTGSKPSTARQEERRGHRAALSHDRTSGPDGTSRASFRARKSFSGSGRSRLGRRMAYGATSLLHAPGAAVGTLVRFAADSAVSLKNSRIIRGPYSGRRYGPSHFGGPAKLHTAKSRRTADISTPQGG